MKSHGMAITVITHIHEDMKSIVVKKRSMRWPYNRPNDLVVLAVLPAARSRESCSFWV